jgi:hypothetical protein
MPCRDNLIIGLNSRAAGASRPEGWGFLLAKDSIGGHGAVGWGHHVKNVGLNHKSTCYLIRGCETAQAETL